MKKIIPLIFLAAILLSACKVVYYQPYPSSVEYIYYGHHPIPSYLGGGMCYINGRHIHNYPPENVNAYYYYEDTYFFIGPTIAYFGPHPIPPAFGGGVCLIHGYHTHNYYPYGSGYVYYPDDNIFVYVDVDINVSDRKPYEPKNRHGSYSSGIPYSDKGGRHEYRPDTRGSSQPGTTSDSHEYSGGSSSKGSSKDTGGNTPVISHPSRPEFNTIPKKNEQSDSKKDSQPDSGDKNVSNEQQRIEIPDAAKRKIEIENKSNTGPSSQTEKRDDGGSSPVINTPDATKRRIERDNSIPPINMPDETRKRPDINTGPKKFDTPAPKKFTPFDTNKKKENKWLDLPKVDTEKKKGSSDEEEDEHKIKKVYQKDQVKLPGVDKKIPSPEPVSK